MYWGYSLEGWGISGTLQRRGGFLLTWTQRYMAYKEMGLSLYRKTEATGSQDVLPKAVTGSSASGCLCVINNRSTYCLPPTPLTRCWLECRKQVTAACRRAFRASNISRFLLCFISLKFVTLIFVMKYNGQIQIQNKVTRCLSPYGQTDREKKSEKSILIIL